MFSRASRPRRCRTCGWSVGGVSAGRWRPKACVEFEHEKRQWKPRSFSHAPGVLEVAHDLEELLVRLGARADEPRLHRPDVLQRILGRFPARRDRGSHLTVIDSAPGTRFTRSPEGMRKQLPSDERARTTSRGACTRGVSPRTERERDRVDDVATWHSRAASTAVPRRDCDERQVRFQESRGEGTRVGWLHGKRAGS